MVRYVVRRLLLMPCMLLAMTVVLFYLLHVRPGDAAMVSVGLTGSCEECVQNLRDEMGLDRPAHVQYLDWLFDALRGDFGKTLTGRDPIGPRLLEAFPKTFELAVLTVLLTLLIGVPCGVLCAVKRGTWVDYLLRVLSLLGLSIPAFWLATLLILVPAIAWGWTPLVRNYVSPMDDPVQNVRIIFWPALTLSIGTSAYVARLVRSTMLETLQADYVRTARAKGLLDSTVVLRHVFRNSMVVILTLIGIQFGVILGGSVLMESIYGIAGLGSITLAAVLGQDYPLLLAVTVVYASAFLLISLLIDVLYVYADPRIRY